MNNNPAVETLFSKYLEMEVSDPLDQDRETALSKVVDALGENAAAEAALHDFQYAALRAAFYAGFRVSMQLISGFYPVNGR